MTPTGLYVYGVVGAAHPCLLARLTGVAGPPRAVAAGPVAAVVGAAPPDLRAKRRHLLAHHAVLDVLARQGTVLPMRFGVVSPDEAALRRDLTAGAERYLALLGELGGRVELNVKAFPDEERMLREIAAHEPVVRALRSRTSTTLSDRLELGQAVAAALVTRQKSLARDLVARLGPLAARTRAGPTVPGCAANTAFLVDTDRVEVFGSAVEALARDLGPAVDLRRAGPLPPYSFVAEEGAGGWDS